MGFHSRQAVPERLRSRPAHNSYFNLDKMKRTVLILAIFIAGSTMADAYGQTGPKAGIPDGNGFVVNKGKQNWFFSFGGNANVYMGQEDNQLYFKHRIGYGGSLFFGKWITPWIGMKFGVDAAQYKGAVLNGEGGNFIVPGETWDLSKTRYGIRELQVQRFFAFNPNIDVFVSLLNSLGKVKDDRVYDLILSGGAGLMVNSGNKVNAATNTRGDYNIYSPTINIGIQNRFRLSAGWDMNIDVKAGWVANSFDGQFWNGYKIRRGDFFGSVGLSFSYRFKPRGTAAFNPDVYRNEIDGYRVALNDMESRYNDLLAENGRLKEENTALAEENKALQKVPAPAAVKEKPAATVAGSRVLATIEYPIGSSVLSNEDLRKLREVAEIMKNNPDNTYEICGYADNATGSKNINIRLRNARANRAIDMLLFYGANRNQILKATNDGELPGTSSRAIVIREVYCE